jgi:CheY-like chemotaxis protein
VADDHVANRKVAVSMLASLGLRADAAASGREALDLLRRMRYDLVLMDCQMPGMSGQEAAAEIRRREGSSHHTPIVSMADNAKRDCQQRCLDCGMDDILHKPVRMQSLLEVVEKWIFRPGTVIVLSSSATAVDSRGGKVAAGTPGGFGPTTPQA